MKRNVYADQERRGSRFVHGMTGTPTFKSWDASLQRCHNPNSPDFARYGARGISVCERWRRSFVAFLEDMGPRPPRTTLDRVDNQGNYEPGNCKWSTAKEQARNRRSSLSVSVSGATLSFAEACERAGLPQNVVRGRLNNGYTLDVALTPGRMKFGQLRELSGQPRRVSKMEKNIGERNAA